MYHIYCLKFVGIFPLYSYRVSPVPSSDVQKGASGVVDDGSKSSGCLGRNTIADAAAKVGPAVVNLSISQGIRFGNWDLFTFNIFNLACSGIYLEIMHQPCRGLWNDYWKEYWLWNNY